MFLIYYTKFEVDLFPNSRDRSFAEEFATVATGFYHSDVTTVDALPLHGDDLPQVRRSKRMMRRSSPPSHSDCAADTRYMLL